jgi:hypothetical protein
MTATGKLRMYPKDMAREGKMHFLIYKSMTVSPPAYPRQILTVWKRLNTSSGMFQHLRKSVFNMSKIMLISS